MSGQHSCPHCGSEADYRLGELHCPSCGHTQQMLPEQPGQQQRFAGTVRPSQGNYAQTGGDPLVRGASGDRIPGQLIRLQGGRGAEPRLSYGSSGPGTAEMSLFLVCYFVSLILGRMILNAVLQVQDPAGMLVTVIGAAVWTGFLAFLISSQLDCLKQFVMVIAFISALSALGLLYLCIRDGFYLNAVYSGINFLISGWLASILYRQNIYEGI